MTNDIIDPSLYKRLYETVKHYLDTIKDIGFAKTEYTALNHDLDTPEKLVETIESIINTSKELNQILEQAPTSIYISDANGKTLHVNNAFENLSKINRKQLLDKNVSNLENDMIFWPSIIRLVLKEQKRLTIQQTNRSNIDFFVTGSPILDENGNMFRAISNAIPNEEIKKIMTYLDSQENSNVPQQQATDKLIAESPQMKNIIETADSIKNTNATVIIEGETGVGKNVLARYMHETSNRSSNKITEINCGAIPEALLESEIFGYEGGAFTGANKSGKKGLIEISNGGTIVLDEIGEMPLLLQVKLLQFLQRKKFIRVGGTKEISVDVRVIATTNTSLERLVEQNKFRADLFYRLNVIHIMIPPLRKRREDIMPAIEYFLDKYNTIYNQSAFIEQEHLEQLITENWPGNTRELENYIERLVLTKGNHETSNSNALSNASTMLINLDKDNMEDIENKVILRTYEKYKSTYKVAEILGMSQSTVYRKIKKYLESEQNK